MTNRCETGGSLDPERAPEALAQVEVARDELRSGLRTLRRVVPRRRPPEALVSFEAGDLVIRIGGASVRAMAQGRWDGVARTSGHALANFDRSLPDLDRIPVRVAGEHFKIGTVGWPCHWQSEAPGAVRVPVDPGLLHLLRLPREHDWDAIEAAGLCAQVDEAEAKREALLEQAAQILAPLELGVEELGACVDRKIQERFGVEELGACVDRKIQERFGVE